jgi:hypothetical protein
MDCAMLAPKAEVIIFPWKEPRERIPLAVRLIHSFRKAHLPAELAPFGLERLQEKRMGSR